MMDPGATPPAAPSKPQAAPPSTQPAPHGPLSGPAVNDPRVGVTLVDRDLSGRVRRLEITPIEAGSRLLRLDEPTRLAVEKALAQRARLLDQVVADHLGLILRLAGAREAGQRDNIQKYLRELSDEAPVLRDLSALQRDVHAALSTPQRDELIRLTQDYWNAIIEEKQAEAKRDGKEFKPAQTREWLRAEFMAIAGQELRRAYDRVIGQKVRDFDSLLKALDLTPEQESKIRQIAGDAFQKNEGRARATETARVFTLIYRALEPEQREKLTDHLKGILRDRAPDAPGAAEPMKPDSDR
jgi:hypothetical protein